MSDLIMEKPSCRTLATQACPTVKTLLEPQEKDLGGFSVRRLLPTRELRAVGPFVFFDHLGPAEFPAGRGIDVRPHPHIGLATVTYVFEGEILHRDSLGNVQPIRPQAINWMTAGRGIVHSERTPPEVRRSAHTLHALQLWVALPEARERMAPSFRHYGADALPLLEEKGRSMRVLIGEAFGARSQVETVSPTVSIEATLQRGAAIPVPDQVEERAVYVVSGRVSARGTQLPAHTMAVFDQSPRIILKAEEDSRLVIIGGAPVGKRTIWWNLVASRQELIEEAKEKWRQGEFPDVPGETEFIPLPE